MDFYLEKSVNHQVANIAVLLKRQVYRIIAEHNLDITPEQWIVLYYLWRDDGLTIGEIAKRSKKDYGNISRIVDKLVKMGYVLKQKDAIDSRVSHIILQAKADEIKEATESCWIASTNIAMKGFKQEEQDTMLSLLKRMENNILMVDES